MRLIFSPKRRDNLVRMALQQGDAHHRVEDGVCTRAYPPPLLGNQDQEATVRQLQGRPVARVRGGTHAALASWRPPVRDAAERTHWASWLAASAWVAAVPSVRSSRFPAITSQRPGFRRDT